MSKEVKAWPLPASRAGANLNTAAFDGKGRIWFTGQTGIYGRLDPVTGKMDVWDAPKGVGPYGITATPSGDIYYVSLAGSFLGKPDLETGETTVIEPKTKNAGTRRVWSDSKGRLWVSEWNAGNLSVYDILARSRVFSIGGVVLDQCGGRGQQAATLIREELCSDALQSRHVAEYTGQGGRTLPWIH